MLSEQQARRRLVQAKKGDPDAINDVALYVYERFIDRLRALFSKDPAVSIEDLESTFFIGIQRHVPKADGRGCDFYHIGQRGFWAVGSEIRALRRFHEHRTMYQVMTGDEGEQLDVMDQQADPASDFTDLVINTVDAKNVIRILVNAPLKDRAREALEIICSGVLGDPTELGFNKSLAEAMGISQQRASQLMGEMRELLGDRL